MSDRYVRVRDRQGIFERAPAITPSIFDRVRALTADEPVERKTTIFVDTQGASFMTHHRKGSGDLSMAYPAHV